jgi:hypothetical protein
MPALGQKHVQRTSRCPLSANSGHSGQQGLRPAGRRSSIMNFGAIAVTLSLELSIALACTASR